MNYAKIALAACFAVLLGYAGVSAAGEKAGAETYVLDAPFHEKYNSYIAFFNARNGDLRKALNHYYSTVGKDEYKPEKDGFAYQKYIILKTTEPALREAAAYTGKAPALPLDQTVAAQSPVALALLGMLRDADTYYGTGDYRDDSLAKGKALHAKILAAGGELQALGQGSLDRLRALEQAVGAQEMRKMQDEGRFVAAAMLRMLQAGEAGYTWLADRDIDDRNLHTLNVEEFQPRYDAIKQALADLEEAVQAHPPAKEGLSSGSVSSFVKVATDMKACVSNMMALAKKGKPDKPSIKVVKSPKNELPSDFMNQLNKLIDVYNRK